MELFAQEEWDGVVWVSQEFVILMWRNGPVHSPSGRVKSAKRIW